MNFPTDEDREAFLDAAVDVREKLKALTPAQFAVFDALYLNDPKAGPASVLDELVQLGLAACASKVSSLTGHGIASYWVPEMPHMVRSVFFDEQGRLKP